MIYNENVNRPHRIRGQSQCLRAVHGDRLPEAPVNVLPVNIQPKNETVGRVVFDPSNAGGSTVVNQLSYNKDTVNQGETQR